MCQSLVCYTEETLEREAGAVGDAGNGLYDASPCRDTSLPHSIVFLPTLHISRNDFNTAIPVSANNSYAATAAGGSIRTRLGSSARVGADRMKRKDFY